MRSRPTRFLSPRLVLAVAALFVVGVACGGGSSKKRGGAIGPPTSLTATPGLLDVVVTWPPVTKATSYNLYWSTSPGVNMSSGTPVIGAASPFTHSGLTSGVTYHYVVTSLLDTKEGPESVEASALFAGPPPPTISATGGSTDIRVDWVVDPSIDSYNLYWSTTPGVTRTTGTLVIGVTPPWDHTGLPLNTTHYYVVTSIVSTVEGLESSEASASTVTPVAGMLDAGFGTAGIFTHDSAAGGGSIDHGNALSVDASGRLLVTGYSFNAVSHEVLVVWRLDDDGTLDTTFGPGGQGFTTYDSGGTSFDFDEGWGVFEDSAGRIVVGGLIWTAAGGQDMGTLRFDATGMLDLSYGTAGVFTHDGAAGVPGVDDWGWMMILDSAGRAVVTGSSENSNGDGDMVTWRVLDTGTLDPAFGTGGVVVHDSAAGGGDWDEGFAVVEDGSGRLVVTGYSFGTTTICDMVVWRLDGSGILDPTFDGDGIFTHHDAAGGGSDDFGENLLVDASGRIYVTGISTRTAFPDYDMVIWALDDTGALDPGFGTGGIVTHHDAAGGGGWDDGLGIVLDAFGRVFVCGLSNGVNLDWDMTVWGWDIATASLDPAFATGGLFVHDSAAGGSGDDVGSAMILDPLGRLVITGRSRSATGPEDMVVWRLE